jgi:putative DNA methylase
MGSTQGRDLKDYWPRSELPDGFMTHREGGFPNMAFTHWWTMFNPRQLLVHAQLLKAIVDSASYDWTVREYVLGAFQQYLRNQSCSASGMSKQTSWSPQFRTTTFIRKSLLSRTAYSVDWARQLGIQHRRDLEGRDWAVRLGRRER